VTHPLVYWRFYQDGGIECEVRATGVMVTSDITAPGSFGFFDRNPALDVPPGGHHH